MKVELFKSKISLIFINVYFILPIEVSEIINIRNKRINIMDFKEGFKEFGKALINIGVASVIFAIIQPIVKGEFSGKLGIIALIMFLTLSSVGILLISLGGKNNDC